MFKEKPILLTSVSFIVVALAYAAFYVLWDKPIALWAHSHLAGTTLYHLSTLIGKVLKPSHWFAVAIVVGIVSLILNKTWSPKAIFWSVTIVITCVLCFALKVILGRYRPDMLFQHQLYGFHWFSLKHNMNSSPSGHASLAFAGLYSLSILIKKHWATALLLLGALIISLSRIVATDHFVSDIIFGAYLGLITVLWLDLIRTTKRTKNA